MKTIIPQFIALISAGLLAGAFMYGLVNIIPTFYEVPVSVHLQYRIQLIRHNTITMQTLIILSIFAPLWYAGMSRYSPRITVPAVISSLLALTCLLVTRFGNAPINQQIKTWTIGNMPDDWLTILHTWDQYNLVRSLAALGCFLSFIAANLLDRVKA